VLISDRAFAGSDTWATSYTLACAIKKLEGFDIIFCGKQAADGDTAQVGPGISMHLDVPQVTYVKKIEQISSASARVERMTEEGYEIIEAPLPALFTVVKEINQPRIPSLKGKMRAKSAQIKILTAKAIDADEKCLGLNGSPTQVVRIFTPPAREGGQMLTGSVDEIVGKIITAIKDECKPKF
jgi:electron transfer flavoprotein beta subunit